MSSARRRMLLWTLPITLMLLSGLFFAGLVFANLTLNGFGIDSDDNTSPQIALYSGLSDGAPSNDWAAGPDAGSGVSSQVRQPLIPRQQTATALTSISVTSTAWRPFICDGHSKLSEEDRNIISGGKQIDDIWIIKNPSGSSGLGTPKSDFTHGYACLSFGESCADRGDADNLFLFMAGHRANNEGDAYWVFEFNQRAPADFSQALNPFDGSTRELDFDGLCLSVRPGGSLRGSSRLGFPLRGGGGTRSLYGGDVSCPTARPRFGTLGGPSPANTGAAARAASRAITTTKTNEN